MMHTTPRDVSRHIRAEVFNYLGGLPSKIKSGTVDMGTVAIQVGNLLIWISGTLDADGEGLPTAKLGDQFRDAGISQLPVPLTPDALTNLRKAIDDLRLLERSVSHALK